MNARLLRRGRFSERSMSRTLASRCEAHSLGKAPKGRARRKSMRLDDLFHGTKRRLGIGPWSRGYFERRFAERDPWSYETSEYERTKYRRTLETMPALARAHVLEVGCAEGVFTACLAERGAHVLAVDICASALLRAQHRCAAWAGLRFACLDISSAPVRGSFDLVLCAEVLYYLHQRGLCKARDRLVSRLKPGGRMVLVHPLKDAERIHPVIAAHPSLAALTERTWSDSTRPYTITLLEKSG
jgi:2-polyprenyl-3-methyl-5-hydroxy-6-metoxy-1,4-benzoquinol methylase